MNLTLLFCLLGAALLVYGCFIVGGRGPLPTFEYFSASPARRAKMKKRSTCRAVAALSWYLAALFLLAAASVFLESEWMYLLVVGLGLALAAGVLVWTFFGDGIAARLKKAPAKDAAKPAADKPAKPGSEPPAG